MNEIISLKFSEVKLRLSKLSMNGSIKDKTASEIKSLLNDGENSVPTKNLFKDYFDVFIKRKTKNRTVESYQYTFEKIKSYTDIKDLTFQDINIAFIKEFDLFLSKTCSVNTRSIHLRNLRSIFNSAIDDNLIPIDFYPFRRFRIKTTPTMKRSLSIEELRILKDYPCEEHQVKYRDIFMLSFYLAGINMVDLLYLSKDATDKLEYTRSKTGIPCSIEIPQEALDIIEKYKGEKYLLNIMDRYKDHRDFIHRMNLNLQQIGVVEFVEKDIRGKKRMVKNRKPLFPNLTTYWARHAWASIAADLDIPDAIIDMSLGHKSPYPMSDIYIKRNLKKVNEAIRKVIDYVNSIQPHSGINQFGAESRYTSETSTRQR